MTRDIEWDDEFLDDYFGCGNSYCEFCGEYYEEDELEDDNPTSTSTGVAE